MKYRTLLLLLTLCLCGIAGAQTYKPQTARYIKTSKGYLMVLQQGDTLFKELEKLALSEQIPSASFTGFGFVNVTFGYFNAKKKAYRPKHFKAVEMASMQGSLAWQNDQPSIHVHGLVAGKKFKAYGGHILSATVGTGSLEITVTVNEQELQRLKDEKLGANVLCIDACK